MWDNWRRALTPELQRRGLWIEVGGHGYENFLHADMEGGRLFERNPEWFGLDEAGRRVRTTRAVFCTSNRQAKDYFLGNVLDYLNTHPEIQIFDFWPPDGARWCQCAACQALGSPSDRQALLLAEVAAAVRARHPSLRFETIAYAACVAPPSRAVLDPRVLIDFCPIAQCFEFQINDPKAEKNADYVSQLKAWLPSFKGDLSLYSYYRKYAWQSLPNLIPHYMQEDLRFYREAGVRGVSSYAEPGDWAAYELNHYVLGALAWNPDTDVEATVAEFAQGRFGGQAALALRAYSLLEDDVRDFCSLPGTTLKSPADYQGPAESLRGLASQLNRAADAEEAAGPRAALRRLALTVGYAERDLLLQQARAANADHQQRRAILDNLTRFLNAHRGEGIFLLDRISADKQAARYGLNQE